MITKFCVITHGHWAKFDNFFEAVNYCNKHDLPAECVIELVEK